LKVCRRIVTVVAAATLVGGAADAGHLRKIWDFNAGDGYRDGTGRIGPALVVFALSFSPDGRYIAAVVGRSSSEESVLIVNASTPQASDRMLDVNPKMSAVDLYDRMQIKWSPSGQRILLNRQIVDLANGNTCFLPEETGQRDFLFSGPAEVAAQQIKPMRLLFFDLACHATGQLDLGNDLWNIYDASADHGRLLLWQQYYHAVGSVEWGLSLLDAGSRTIFQRMPLLERGKFADGGNTVCGVGGAEWHHAVECVDIDTGKHLAATKGWTDPDLQTALHGKRIILSDYGRHLDWIDGVWRPGSLKRRVVWDFGAGKELSSWHPRLQSIILGAHRQSLPFQFAISPDGEYVVEGGAGALALYRIEP
jgi:hypothetical protein